VVILQKVGVRRPEPCHSARNEDDQWRPLLDQWQEWQALGSSRACDVDDTCREMGDKEGEQDDRYPKLFKGNLADFCLVGREVVRERGGPDLGAKVAGRADEETRQNEAL
jgi:hypothetical protein